MTRRVLGDLLDARPSIVLAEHTSSPQEAVDAAVQVRPDVVLIDIRLPDVRAVLACRTIRSNLPLCHVLLLSTSADFRTVLAAVMSGASGHVLKSLDLAPLQAAIEAAGHGRMRLDRRIAEGVVEWFCGPTLTSADRGTSLTVSEADMLLLADIAAGRLDSDIARETGRSPSDVQGEVARLYEVLNNDRGFAATGNALARLFKTPGERGRGISPPTLGCRL